MPRPSLAFLHTAQVHVATFDALLTRLAPDVRVRHLVEPTLLTQARAEGPTDALAGRVRQQLHLLANDADVVVCTCSTIGAVAERQGEHAGLTVIRVDRPMARRAVHLGSRIVVLAALHSTLEPTRHLVEEEARRAGRSVSLRLDVCEDAWPLFEQGNLEGYVERVTACLDDLEGTPDVVVLAQASMADAAQRTRMRIPVLSSPRLGVEAALALTSRPST